MRDTPLPLMLLEVPSDRPLRDYLDEVCAGAVLLEPAHYDAAILGYVLCTGPHPRWGDTPSTPTPCLVYDTARLLALLATEGMSYEDAVEWFDCNIEGAYLGPGTPIFYAPDDEDCPIAVPPPAASTLPSTQRDTLTWLANGETGASSETLAFWLAFSIRKEDGTHPHDTSDLRRCLQLLEHAPGLRAELPRMAEVSPAWARLVARWAELEAQYRAEAGARSAPQTYALMRQLLKPQD